MASACGREVNDLSVWPALTDTVPVAALVALAVRGASAARNPASSG